MLAGYVSINNVIFVCIATQFERRVKYPTPSPHSLIGGYSNRTVRYKSMPYFDIKVWQFWFADRYQCKNNKKVTQSYRARDWKGCPCYVVCQIWCDCFDLMKSSDMGHKWMIEDATIWRDMEHIRWAYRCFNIDFQWLSTNISNFFLMHLKASDFLS